MLRVLLDTNQLVSSLLTSRGLQRELIDAWRRRAFALLVAPGQVEEVEQVLTRPKIAKKYPITRGDRERFLELLRGEGILLPSHERPNVCRDRDDDDLLGCAAAGEADYLVTGDEDLLSLGAYRGVTVVRARVFLSILDSS